MGPSKILGGCDVRSQEFVPVQSCHISCQLAMSQSESAYSAIADWHWTTSNTTEVAIRAPYGDMETWQRRNGDVRTWWHVGKIGPWTSRGDWPTSGHGAQGAELRRGRSVTAGRQLILCGRHASLYHLAEFSGRNLALRVNDKCP